MINPGKDTALSEGLNEQEENKFAVKLSKFILWISP